MLVRHIEANAGNVSPPVSDRGKAPEGFEMIESKTATDGLREIVDGDRATREQSAMLDVQAVADLLDCSSRHVYRMADMGRMPRPVKLGALVRWPRAAIDDWIGQGCPSCRKAVQS